MFYYLVFLHLAWAAHSVVRNGKINDPNTLQQVFCFLLNLVLAPLMMVIAIFTDAVFG